MLNCFLKAKLFKFLKAKECIRSTLLQARLWNSNTRTQKTNQTKKSFPSTQNHWSLTTPLHNCGCTASHTATPWVRTWNWHSSGLTVLGLAATELTFFIPAGMVLCCGFGTKTVLIIQRFTYCRAVFAQHHSLFFFPTLASQQVGWECVRSWERTQPGQLARAIFHDTWHCAQQWKQGEEGGRQDIWGYNICLRK